MKKYKITITRKDEFIIEAEGKNDAIAKALKSFKNNIKFNAEHYPNNLFHYDILDIKEINVKK